MPPSEPPQDHRSEQSAPPGACGATIPPDITRPPAETAPADTLIPDAQQFRQLLDTVSGPELPRASRRSAPRDEVMTYRIRVDLDDSAPPIWRRLDLASNLTLDALHDVLQTAMGWTDSHLHELLVEVGDRLFYLYDFGDDWAHTLTVESFAPRDPADGPAVCLAGAGACY